LDAFARLFGAGRGAPRVGGAIEVANLRGVAPNIKVRFDPGACSFGEPHAQIPILHKPQHGRGQPCRIMLGDH